MRIFYDFFIRSYSLLIGTAANFNQKARLLAEGRKQSFPYLEAKLHNENHPIAWFHCASLGEFEQGRPLIEAFRQEFPNYKILLTFFSPSGYEIRKNYEQADYTCYLPADTAQNARRFMTLCKPAVAFFIKYEFWHHYIKALQEQQIPMLSVSSIFRPGQLFFKPYGGFYKNILKRITHFFVQNQDSAQLLQSIGIQQVTVSGDTRFDRVQQICAHPKKIDFAEAFKNKQPVMVVGSSWPEDIDVLAPLINESDDRLKFIIAPHEIGEEKIQQVENMLDTPTIRYSQASEETLKTARVLIIDNIGMLSSLYQYGEFAYIGGAFGDGLHNTLEAATFGLPVFFGNKNYRKFAEALDLIDTGAAFAIGNSEELQNRFYELYNNEDKRQKAADEAANYVRNKTGATEKVMAFCRKLFS